MKRSFPASEKARMKSAVSVVKAPYQVPIGCIPCQNFFEIWTLKGAIWCSLGGSEASKLYFICTTNITKGILRHSSHVIGKKCYIWIVLKSPAVFVLRYCLVLMNFSKKNFQPCYV